jgi:3-phosphoshikimate 1-carboxyvinyltransferase
MKLCVQPGALQSAKICMPGDKSISHRALILGSIACGKTRVRGFLNGEDNRATLTCMRQLGVQIDEVSESELVVHGVGKQGLVASVEPLNCRNSGTAMRLLAGLLSAQVFDSTLIGDASLSARPMTRITDPLAFMGALIATTGEGTAPLYIQGMHHLKGVTYEMQIASAQVKSCLLLAGLYAKGQTIVRSPGETRDHTERMLKAMQYPITQDGNCISIEGGGELTACDIDIPSDLSSAAFFIVAAAIAKAGMLTLNSVGVNPTRNGILRILKQMGAEITLSNMHTSTNEPIADICIQASQLQGVVISEALVSLAIDELPVIMIAAACAQGKTVLRGASELRVKESDRIHAMVVGLRAVGINVEEYEDGVVIEGGQLNGGEVDSFGDHRIAMSFLIAGLVASAPIIVSNCQPIKTSFPNFISLAQSVGMQVEVVL